MASGNEISNLEFVIDKHCSSFVKDCELRINQLFNVKVQLKKVTCVNDKPIQWVWVSGTTDDANKAKEFILALTSPQETVHLKDVRSHPKFTPQKEDEIEKATNAVLSKTENNGLAIQGTELSVALAMSMIDDMLCEDIDAVKEKRQEENVKYHNAGVGGKPGNSVKHGKSVTPLNQNNSSLTSCLSHASPHLENSDVCYGNYAATDLSWDTRQEPQAKRSLNPGRVGNNALYASASAKTHTTLSSQAANPALATPFYSNEQYAEKHSQYSMADATFNDKGGQPVSKADSLNPQNGPNILYGQERQGETGMEICDTHVKPFSPQAKGQQEYLKNLGLSLHYSVEDINTGLARYSMDDIIKPADFLKMLNQIKAQRHGGSQRSSVMNDNEQPKTTYSTSVSTDAVTSQRSSAKTISSSPQAITVDSVSDLDESVICMGSVSNDAHAIYISSDNESDHSETEALVIAESRLQPPYTAPFHTEPSSSTSRSKVPYQQQYQAQSQPQPQPHQTVPAQPPTEEWSLRRNHADSMNSLPPRRTGRSDLRYIVIDGSNVAMAHGKNKVFSVEGLKICINYFVKRGHDQITAFVPEWRRYSENKKLITNRALLEKLNGEGYVEFTPARRIAGKVIHSYDDRYCLNLAMKEDGIVVSNDQFRDLIQEQASYHDIVATRLLPFVFVNNHFMPPDDPLGRDGPHLDEFLRKLVQPPPPRRPVSNTSRPQPPLSKPTHPVPRILAERDATKNPIKASTNRQGGDRGKGAPLRSLAVTEQLFEQLTQVFPDPKQQPQIRSILENHKRETDLNRLTNYCANALFT